MPEPSVLDYIKTVLAGKRAPAIPVLPKGKTARVKAPTRARSQSPSGGIFNFRQIPWRSFAAFLLFLWAQAALAAPHGSLFLRGLLFFLAFALSLWAFREGEWRLPELQEAKPEKRILVFRRTPFMLSLLFFGLTLLFSGGNRFNFPIITLWLISIVLILFAFWQRRESLRTSWRRARAGLQRKEWDLHVSRWTILLLVAFALIAFFRFHQLNSIPPEMTSDHAEKLLDVYDIQRGQLSIFFTRNSGREPLQFYLIDLMVNVFNTGLSFLSLKLSTVIPAFVSLIFMYLLGKELGGRWVGLFALLLTGFSFWANLLARIGLRFSLYPILAAPTLYYLLRGLRRGSLNDFLLSGLILGIGLGGYSAFRIMPLVALVAFVIFLLHRATPEQSHRALIGFALLALVSLVVFTPLLRYMIDNFAEFAERMLTRIGEAERPYPGFAPLIFVQNVIRALGLFNYSGGQIWTVGLVGRPAFDLFSAALFLLGVFIVLMRYVRRRNWQDLFLLLAVPLMMLPSTLALAFPEENPAMNRASGAWIPAFLICALGLDAFLHGLRDRLGGQRGLRAAQLTGGAIFALIALLNYGLFFKDYRQQYDYYSWNTSEIGKVIGDYAASFGSLDSAWVVAYPYWVDTRLVAINARYPQHDYGIWPDQLSNTLSVLPPKLFLLKPEDAEGLTTLQQLYPEGILTQRQSRIPTKEFLVFFVPAQTNGN